MNHDSLYNLLAARFRAAVAEVAGTDPSVTDPVLRAAGDPKFGDYQCNVAMSLARPLKAKPRDIAQRIKETVGPQLADIAEPLEIAGPGFLNIRLKDTFLANYLAEIPAPPAESDRCDAEVDRLGMPPAPDPVRVVIDYSQPNIAKQMHVGHLRSTVIGDVFARVLAFEGHEVIRQNHIGDWGTQFGLLIRWYREHSLPTPQMHEDVLEAIENDYKAANARDREDPEFAAEARQAVTALQSGDPEARRVWEQICAESWDAFTEIYERLGVLLTRDDVRGESFYNDRLAGTVEELRTTLGAEAENRAQEGQTVSTPRAEVRDDQGAVCVFLYDAKGEPAFKNPDGDILPMIIQKSDGAYLYATTDLAAIRYRLEDLKARRVIYVTDARQKLHFDMWMACARSAGWITNDVQVEHVTFGSVLGPDRKPLKTREGGTVKLRVLLDEAQSRALKLMEERGNSGGEATERRDDEGKAEWQTGGGSVHPQSVPLEECRDTLKQSEGDQRSAAVRESIAQRVGVASVKYADLRNDRTSDYVFTWDKMISFQGNTAPYMMYAYARIRSIYRKAAERIGSADVYGADVAVDVGEPAERALALRLARLREAIDQVAADLTPHTLCTYLYDLAGEFMRFYESCPVLTAPDDATRLSRLRLCDLTARTLKLGLGLLGIQVIERM